MGTLFGSNEAISPSLGNSAGSGLYVINTVSLVEAMTNPDAHAIRPCPLYVALKANKL
jgi:hypothetical protein